MLKHIKNIEGAGALMAAAFIYSTFGIWIREIAKMLDTGAQTMIRFALAGAIAAGMYVLARKVIRLSRQELLFALALGVVFGGVVLLFTISVTNTTIANSTFLLYAGSIFSSFLIGTFIFKEKVTGIKLLAIGIGLVGLAMYSNSFLSLSLGVVTAFASGLLDGVANGIRKKLKGVDRNVVIGISYGAGAVIALVFALFWEGGIQVHEVSTVTILTIVLFSVLLVFLSNLLLFGFQHFDVNVGTVILACELLFATLLGYLVFGETPAPNELFGGILIFAASVIASVDLPALFGRKKTARTVKVS